MHKTGFKSQSQYRELLDSVAYWTASSPPPDETLRQCKLLIASGNSIRPYAILLSNYLLLKAGKAFRKKHNECFGQLKQLAESRLKESAAARWILARIYANDIAYEQSPQTRYNLLREAFKQISVITEPVEQLEFPVLLPGIKCESVPELLEDCNGVSDPSVKYIPVPYRYLSAYLMSFAYEHIKVNHNEGVELMRTARQFCVMSKEKNGIFHPYLSQNIAQASSCIDTILWRQGKREINKGKVIDDFLGHIEKVEAYTKTYQLDEAKSYEWKATCNAAIAALSSDSDLRHIDYLKAFHDQAKFLVQLTKGKADYFEIDTIYKLAHFNENEENEFKKLIAYPPLNSSTSSAINNLKANSYNEALNRVRWLKHVIENKDGYKVFYFKGRPIKREVNLHSLYTCSWYNAYHDVNKEVNNGRGPVDFAISEGFIDKTLVEFKLASNPKLRQNLTNQVEIYKKASGASNSIKAIMYFNESEYNKTQKILQSLGVASAENIILINAAPKVSASNVK
jgi:hypothetical protein